MNKEGKDSARQLLSYCTTFLLKPFFVSHYFSRQLLALGKILRGQGRGGGGGGTLWRRRGWAKGGAIATAAACCSNTVELLQPWHPLNNIRAGGSTRSKKILSYYCCVLASYLADLTPDTQSERSAVTSVRQCSAINSSMSILVVQYRCTPVI